MIMRHAYAHADVHTGRGHRSIGVHRRGTHAADRRRIPQFELVLATGDTMAGKRAADLYPSLEIGYPSLRYEPFDPAAPPGSTW